MTSRATQKPSSIIIAALLGAATASGAIAGPAPVDLIAGFSGDGTAADSSGFHNNASFTGTYTDHAFNLATGSFSANDIASYNLNQYAGFTVALWFNYNGTTASRSNGTFLGQDEGAGEKPKWFVDYGYTNPGPSDAYVLHINNYGSNPRVFLVSRSMSAATSGWHQFVVSRDSGQVSFYLDGQGIGSQAYTGIVPNVAAPLRMGSLESCCGFAGLISGVQITSSAWTAEQVASSFDAGRVMPNVPEPSTTVMWLIGALTLAWRSGLALRRSGQAA